MLDPQRQNSGPRATDSAAGNSFASAQADTFDRSAHTHNQATRADALCAVVANSLKIRTSQGSLAPLMTATAILRRGSGAEIAHRVAAFQRNPEDVTSLLGFDLATQTFIVGRAARPALLARSQINLPVYGDAVLGAPLGCVGGYLRVGIATTAGQLARNKLFSPQSARFERLGSSVLPNPKDSLEVDLPLLAIFNSYRPTNPSGPQFDPFQHGRTAESYGAQEIIERIYGDGIPAEQRITDPRLFVYLERAAALLRMHHGVDLNLRAPLLIEQFVSEMLLRPTNLLSAPRVTTLTDLREFTRIGSLSRSGRSYSLVDLENPSIADSSAGITHQEGLFRFSQSQSVGAGTSPDRAIPFECILPEKDRLLVGVFTQINGEVHVLVSVGVRASVEYRRRETRLLQNQSPVTHLEAPFIEVSPETIAVGPGRLAAQAGEFVTNLLGADGHTTFVQMTPARLFPSPGFNARGLLHALCYVQPEALRSVSNSPDYALVPLKDLMIAQDEGVVRDLGTMLTTTLLSIALPTNARYHPDQLPSLSASLLRESSLSDNQLSSDVFQWCPALPPLIKSRPLLHHLICTRGNIGGLRMLALPAAAGADVYFFNSNLEVFLVHPTATALEVAQLLVHDSYHYHNPDPLPVVPPSEKLRASFFTEYLEKVVQREAEAVTFSDVWLPIVYGLEAFEADTGSGQNGKGSIAGLLVTAGIISNGGPNQSLSAVELERAYRVVHQALRYGRLDRRITALLRKNSAAEQHFRDCVQEKLIGYHVRDTSKNIRMIFDGWISNPNALAVARRFHSTRADRPNGSFTQGLARLEQDLSSAASSSGFNPLSALCARVLLHELYHPALRLAYLTDHLGYTARNEPPLVDEVDRTLQEAIDSYHHLQRKQALICSADFSADNLAVTELISELRSGVIPEIRRLTEDVKKRTLSDEELADFERHPFLPFPTLIFDPRSDEAMKQQIAQRYAAALV